MMRRAGHTGRRGLRSGSYVDPARTLNASGAWRADESVGNGSVTTLIPPFWGSPPPLSASGTGQSLKAASSNLNGAFSITCNGVGASGGYSAVVLGGAPTVLSVLTVARVTATNSGLYALTAAGSVNSGVSQLYFSGTLKSRKLAVDVTGTAIATSFNVVQLSLFSAAGVTHYVNSLTPVTVAQAGALAGTTMSAAVIDSAGTFTLTGEWSYMAYWLRALSSEEARLAMNTMGSKYGITIS